MEVKKENMLPLLIAFEIMGPCSDKPLFTGKALEAQTIGEATVKTLWANHIAFQGTDRGLNTIMNLPGKDESLEVLSDTDMRAYGWCFDVDGEIPEVYPDQIPLHQGMKKIRWFHGYAEMKGGQWVSQCQVTAKLKPRFLCH